MNRRSIIWLAFASVASAFAAKPASPPGKKSRDTTAPTVPTGLIASVISNVVTLTWIASTDDVGVAGYRLYRNGLFIASPQFASYVDYSPTLGATYGYSVSAYDARGNESAQSAPVYITTEQPPLAAPQGLFVIGTTQNSISLSWTAVVGA